MQSRWNQQQCSLQVTGELKFYSLGMPEQERNSVSRYKSAKKHKNQCCGLIPAARWLLQPPQGDGEENQRKNINTSELTTAKETK